MFTFEQTDLYASAHPLRKIVYLCQLVSRRRVALNLRRGQDNRKLGLRLAGGYNDPDLSPLKEDHSVY